MLLLLFASLNKLNHQSFVNKNRTKRKMISIEVAVIVETNKLQANQRVTKEL